jgi:transposase
MKITQEQKKKIISLFPKPRGNVKIDGGVLLEALIHICENGCTWRSLPASFGPWHTICMRISRRAKNGVLERIYGQLKEELIMNGPASVVSLDSTSVKVHPGAAGALKKTENRRREDPGEA